MHYIVPKKEATGQVHDAEMFHLASSGRVQVLWRREVSCAVTEHRLARKIATISNSRSDNRYAPWT